MKRLLFLFSIFMCLIVMTQPASAQAIPDNQIVLYPVKDDPTISFRIWFKVGSQNDPKEKEGFAVMTASLMTSGATKKNTYGTILEKFYPLASSYSSSVDKEMTMIYGRTHKDNLDVFYGLLKDAIFEPAFNEDDFTRIKTQTLSGIEKTLRYSSDEELGKAALYDFIYGGTAYGHLNAGTVSSMNSITLDDVKNFY